MSTMSGWHCSHSMLGLAPVFDVSICAAASGCAASANTQQLVAADFLPVFDSCEEDRRLSFPLFSLSVLMCQALLAQKALPACRDLLEISYT